MINYTERIALLMQDVVSRTPALGFIDLREVLVFGRFGRPDAEGAFATCHCLTLPETEPGYYFWKDRATGELTRRSEWFVTKTPEVRLGATRIKYLISFVLPRFCEQTLERSWKAELYDEPLKAVPWVAKLDTIIHELYHIDPAAAGLRQFAHADGNAQPAHARARVLRGRGENDPPLPRDRIPIPRVYDFLRWDFAALHCALRRRDGDDVQEFPVLPAALHGAVHGAAGGISRGRESGAVEARRSSRRSTPKAICTCASSPTRPRGAWSENPSRSNKPRSPVRRAHPLHAHLAGPARRVHELVPADRNPDV